MHGITTTLTTTTTSKLMKAPNGQMVKVPLQNFRIENAQETRDGVSLKYVSSSKWFPEGRKVIPNERIDEVIRQLPEGTELNYRISAYFDKSLDSSIRVHIATLLFEDFIERASLETYCRDNIKRKTMDDIVAAVSSVRLDGKKESTASGGSA